MLQNFWAGSKVPVRPFPGSSLGLPGSSLGLWPSPTHGRKGEHRVISMTAAPGLLATMLTLWTTGVTAAAVVVAGMVRQASFIDPVMF